MSLYQRMGYSRMLLLLKDGYVIIRILVIRAVALILVEAIHHWLVAKIALRGRSISV